MAFLLKKNFQQTTKIANKINYLAVIDKIHLGFYIFILECQVILNAIFEEYYFSDEI